MRVIGYLSEDNERLYDFDMMKRLLKTNKSKLHREIKNQGITINDCVKYKNQYLYKESSFYLLLEKFLYEKLDRRLKNEY
jgi:hypothetical protein